MTTMSGCLTRTPREGYHGSQGGRPSGRDQAVSVGPGEGRGGDAGKVLDALDLCRRWVTALAEVRSEGADDDTVLVLDRHAPGSEEAQGHGQVPEFEPFVVGAEVG